MEPDTIAAIVTPIGEAGLAALRISGPRALEIIKKTYSNPSQANDFFSHLLVHGHIKSGDGRAIDEVMVVYMAAPKTYTGEDVVEIFCHGGQAVARLILAEIIAGGARLAERGEFTKRAFLSGKMDLSQAEAVVGLVKAKTPEAVLLAEAQMEGNLSKKTRGWREALLGTLAALEAEIDFSEDIPPLDRQATKSGIEAIIGGLQGLLRTVSTGEIVTSGQVVAIIGKPNVGKSSLLNALLKEDKAIVAEAPGTTRDVVEGWIDIKGMLLRVVDTAGIRETKDRVETIGVARATALIETAPLMLLVLDGSDVQTKEDLDLLRAVDPNRVIVVNNKADLQKNKAKASGQADGVSVSALTGEGVDVLEETIYNYFVSKQGFSLDADIVLTNERQVEAITRSQKALEKALDSLSKDMDAEFVALDVKDAVLALGEVTGEVVTDELLDRVFSSFCVGK
ncbi:MAG: tRNA uridine-5-carboxymethylaminomethyl(34) synthesis GTPase MnmE [Candidatus Saganbacteria bacterium]|nr:tRNA uridine-5-carboxymethylaminomethyl(34) synthesis GTPase MnmE [Candidatus Saganbacteria bacterium]